MSVESALKYTEFMASTHRSTSAGRPTLEMVAREAGVSRATVSRVVNRRSTVDPQIAEHVNRAIKRLNYVPNHSARSLAKRASNAVALVVPENTTKFLRDPFFASIIDGIASRLDENDYVLNLLVTVHDPRTKVERFLRSGTVDGTIVLTHHSGDGPLAELDTTVPTVFGGRRPFNSGDSPHFYIDTDNVDGAAHAAHHLAERGHRRLATITGQLDKAVGRDRLEGFQRGVREAGLEPPIVIAADFSLDSAIAATQQLLDEHPDVEAVFVASDRMAIQTVRTIIRSGRRVPQDIAVVGFGDMAAATEAQPALTTIRQPSIEMGHLLAETVLRLIRGDDDVPRHVVMPSELVIRQTT